MSFQESMARFNLIPRVISVDVTEDVYVEMQRIARENDCELEDLMRDIIDDFILNCPK